MMRTFDRVWNSQRSIVFRRHVKDFFFPVVIVQQSKQRLNSDAYAEPAFLSCLYHIAIRDGFIDVHLSRVIPGSGFGLFAVRTLDNAAGGIHPKTFRAKCVAAASPSLRIKEMVEQWEAQTSSLDTCGCSERGGPCSEHSQLKVKVARVRNNTSVRLPRWRWLNPLANWANTGRIRGVEAEA